jgi:CRP/FNR family cyclic AMP-dependent transcriptional regulator
MQSEVLANLKRIAFLSNLSSDKLEALAAKAKAVKFPRQAIIISEGDETRSLYIILSGKVRVFSSDDKNKEVTLLIQEAGSHFGELALLSDEPRSASVQTLESTSCAMISKPDFLHWLETNPDVAIALLGVLSEKIRYLTEKVKQMALSNVYERTIKALQGIAEKQDDMLVIRNRPTQQELANMVGSSREMINKIMKELTKGGYIILTDEGMIMKSKLPAAW